MSARLSRFGGAAGNERLTSALGLALVVLLVLEAATTLDLRAFLIVHIYLGLFLLPAVSLKLASTAWRAAHYYTRGEEYLALGPPRIVLRVLAPVLVLATVVLFGTGVAFLATGRGGGLLLQLHAVSFAVWGVIMIVHVLAYLPQVLHDGLADWRTRELPGARMRRALLVGSLVAGAVVATATYSVESSWVAHHHHRHDRHDTLVVSGYGRTALKPSSQSRKPPTNAFALSPLRTPAGRSSSCSTSPPPMTT